MACPQDLSKNRLYLQQIRKTTYILSLVETDLKLNTRNVSILIFLIIYYILTSVTLQKLFVKAGEDGWKALVPGLNFVIWTKIIGQPKWWAALLLIPIVNVFIWSGMCVDMVRSFGKYGFWDSFLAVVAAPFPFFQIGKDDKTSYVGQTILLEKAYAEKLREAEEGDDKYKLKKLVKNNPYKKSSGREWAEAIIFAVFAATFIRMFLIEAYVIPTSSMEGSLLVGDFLFVSKAHYGIRTPQTVVQLPLVHNMVPLVGSESYLKNPKLNMTRLNAIENIDRNEAVVFNFPEGDSVYVAPGRTFSVYQTRRMPLNQRRSIERYGLRTRPVDKMDHYIKRCVALPGDKFEIRDRKIYINDQPGEDPTNVQYSYNVTSPGTTLNAKRLAEWNISAEDINGGSGIRPERNNIVLNQSELEKIKGIANNITIEPVSQNAGAPNQYFPNDPKHFGPLKWNNDNYGPITIPKAGATVELSPSNLALYRRIIEVYEGPNKVSVKNGKVLINGQETSTYTFQMDYYWMMGDNRHRSEDSRFWGFVPQTHVVGKPLFIWFSTKDGSLFNGIRWNRIFTTAQKN